MGASKRTARRTICRTLPPLFAKAWRFSGIGFRNRAEIRGLHFAPPFESAARNEGAV